MTAVAFRPQPGAEPVPGYRLEAQLGKGGFGEVWRAVGPGGFKVALKFLPAHEAAAQRELESLRALQELRDLHLLTVFGAWRVPGFHLVAMELADRTLLDRLRQCLKQSLPGVPREELLDYFRQAAAGLDFLNERRHALGPGGAVVSLSHGDVKPHNLFLVGSGCKVGDFGLLRAMAHTVVARSTGTMTLAYSAPETFNGKVARSSDQYALAVSWCQLRGGRLPFEGEPGEVAAGHLLKAPDLSMLPAAESPALERALSKRPEGRWPSCRAFVQALAAAAPEPPPLVAPGPALTTAPGRSEQTAPRSVPPLPPAVAPPVRSIPGRAGQAWRPASGPVPPRSWARASALAAGALLTAGVVLGSVLLLGPRGQPTSSPRQPDPQLTNKVGMKLVWIEPGSFLMGSPDGTTPPRTPAEEGRAAGEAPHQVTLTRGFYLGAALVTQQQWEQVLGPDANRSQFLGKDDEEKKKLPVDNVSWDDCQEFCSRLSALDGRKYTLPTEAEWEYACRAGTTSPFWWGSSISTDQANYDGRSAYGPDGKKGPDRARTTPIDRFPANPWGLFDMHGNLWQWCQDWYNPYPAGPVTDPVDLKKSASDARVLRGGSWHSTPSVCRAACRLRSGPANGFGYFGCRVACRPE
jgi:formylglycine-generating enzyme required for sulfatase activity